jgi:hypothetical protein
MPAPLLKTVADLPALVRQWHPRNSPLRPRDVPQSSKQRIWWRCRKGPDHEWQQRVRHRRDAAIRCPFCSGLRASVTNSVQAKAPELARQWHPKKNGSLRPSQICASSTKSVWWKCKLGRDHEWQASPSTRISGEGCPFCSGHRPSETTSLAATMPEVAEQWHSTRNGALTPHDVVPGSHREVWWQCPQVPGHVWQAPVKLRKRGQGCRHCPRRGKPPRLGKDSLARAAPKIAAEWHPTRNGTLTPAGVYKHAKRRVWWKCPEHEDHEWAAPIRGRVWTRSGCPFCAGTRASPTSSLAARFPQIAAQWHPTKNGELTAVMVGASSGRRVWWKCSAGPDHEWQAPVQSRTKHMSRCSFCLGKRVSVTSSLAAQRPDIAAEWHPTRNRSLKPDGVTVGSNRRVWWKCPRGPDHAWLEAVGPRTRAGRNCPYCAGKRVSVTNSLARCHPSVANEWHPTKNGRLTPHQVTRASSRRAWWQCHGGHEWDAVVSSRTAGSGCWQCALQDAEKRRRNRRRRKGMRVPILIG